VTLLPLHNPVKIAEEAASADILSDGRLELGVGRGTAPLHYSGYDIRQEESRERFDEALDFILKAWTEEIFSFEGKHFRASELSVVPGRSNLPTLGYVSQRTARTPFLWPVGGGFRFSPRR
jgi:alkanesulfonate monooxygenase SsuD/methylene tetrahydromethanopterin reductase-like flavin-dependent oxidoreductase (luciferase family)